MILTDAQHATLEEKFSATQAKHDMEKENKRRLGVSQRMHDLLNATGLLEVELPRFRGRSSAFVLR